MDDRRQPPAELVAEARRVPGGWVYEVEAGYSATDAVPPEAIRGAWAVDDEGNLTGEYRANSGYRRADLRREGDADSCD